MVLIFAKNDGKCAPKQLGHWVVKTVIEPLSNLGLFFLTHLQKVEKQGKTTNQVLKKLHTRLTELSTQNLMELS